LSSNFRQIHPIVDDERPLRRDIEVRNQCVAFGADASAWRPEHLRLDPTGSTAGGLAEPH
jgi:hypothetical protein